MKLLLAIAAGGAVGALGRYYLAGLINAWTGSGFPYGILACNIFGSFLMGLVVEATTQTWLPSQEMRALLAVGVLGSFTTFSTFALDSVLLFERGQYLQAGGYILLSVALSIGGLVAGMQLLRALLA